MITLRKRQAKKNQEEPSPALTNAGYRQKLLLSESKALIDTPTLKVHFPDADILHEFKFTIIPDQGFYEGGKFKFEINVPEEYNIVPPSVKCLTRIYHPNISETGEVCLSLLRQTSISSDSAHGWTPIRQLRDVVWGVEALFSDLLNWDDPLVPDVADHYRRDQESFKYKVKEYIKHYAR